MSWWDRWRGEAVEALGSLVAPGRYAARSGGGLHCGVPVVPGDRLLPLDGARWRWVDAGRGMAGDFAAPDPPDDLVRASVGHIADTLGSAPCVDRLRQTSPLVPGIDQRVRPTRFLEQLEAEARHLLAIARSPHTRLRVSTERRLLDRVKRPARRAPLTLATRADDWEAPTLTGVRPRRLLARVIDEHVDFYENRAAARLIDHILRWLTRRLGELRDLIGLLGVMVDLSERVRDVGWRRRRRLTTLWGEEHDSQAALLTAEATAARVAKMRRYLQGALDSPLYRAVPRRTLIGDALRQTNLLVNDQRYRFVARLWLAWLAARAEPEHDPARRHAESQSLARGFDRFALLIVARALMSLDVELEPADGGPKWRLSWRGRGLDATLTVEADGVMRLVGDRHPERRMVPLPIALNREPKVTAELLDALALGGQPSSAQRTIGLCIDGVPRDEEPPTPPFTPGRSDTATLIAISPLCLESVERVRRALKWWLHAPRIERWPLQVTLPRALSAQLVRAADWLAMGATQAAPRVVGWPAAIERERLLELSNGVERFARRPDDRQAAVEAAHRALSHAVDEARALAVCPECGTQCQRPSRVDGEAIRFTCPSCKASWGSDVCGECGSATPVFDPGTGAGERLGGCAESA